MTSSHGEAESVLGREERRARRNSGRHLKEAKCSVKEARKKQRMEEETIKAKKANKSLEVPKIHFFKKRASSLKNNNTHHTQEEVVPLDGAQPVEQQPLETPRTLSASVNDVQILTRSLSDKQNPVKLEDRVKVTGRGRGRGRRKRIQGPTRGDDHFAIIIMGIIVMFLLCHAPR